MRKNQKNTLFRSDTTDPVYSFFLRIYFSPININATSFSERKLFYGGVYRAIDRFRHKIFGMKITPSIFNYTRITSNVKTFKIDSELFYRHQIAIPNNNTRFGKSTRTIHTRSISDLTRRYQHI